MAGQSPSAMRPLSDPGAARRGAPFAAIALVAVVLELVAPSSTSTRGALILIGASIGVVSVAALTLPWARMPAWSQAVLPLAFFVVVAVLRDARGGAVSGYPPLVMLPVIWMAMYGTRVQLRLAIAGMAVTLMLPLILVGAPRYPSSVWGESVLSVAVGLLAGPSIQRMVAQARHRAADVAALGAITRALTVGFDPRPDLCAAAQLVTDARFVVLFERDDAGSFVATAGTAGLDLEQMRIDPRNENTATAEAWRTGARIYIADVELDRRASARLNRLTGAAALLFEPVTHNGERTAVLVLGFSTSRPRVPEHALYMVELVAAEVAAALDRASLVALLATQAQTDPLTGAANRRSWDEALERELARSQRTGEPLTVAMIDIDHFKDYNDAQGHSAGDDLLRDLVTAFRSELRAGDVIARWGGEEFTITLPACDLDQAGVIAARLLRVVPGEQTVSIGLTQALVGDTARMLIARVDRALYAAKADGRDRVTTIAA